MKRFISIIMLLLVSVTFIIAQEEKVDPEVAKIIQEGDNLLKTGNYSGALAKYDEALKQSDNYQIYYQKGVAYVKLKQIKDAENALLMSIDKNPSNADSYDLLGRINYATKNYESAIDYLNKYMGMIDKESKKKKSKEIISKSYYNLGSQAKNDGKFEQAVAYLEKSIEIDSYDLSCFRLAEVHYELGNYDLTIEYSDKALNNRKTVAKGGPYYYKGMAFKKKGDTEKAKENFKLGEKDREYGALCKHELDNLN